MKGNLCACVLRQNKLFFESLERQRANLRSAVLVSLFATTHSFKKAVNRRCTSIPFRSTVSPTKLPCWAVCPFRPRELDIALLAARGGYFKPKPRANPDTVQYPDTFPLHKVLPLLVVYHSRLIYWYPGTKYRENLTN